ncbi:NAD-dependent epimerase/dehydratase family protein [Halalkalibacter oceani]|uniref:NAD-dependent epimerase/dehydratase family protein n=1 Tax=Halalkalibacter oceani TaxID=1653776 RepID=UPI0033954688
MTVLITGGCGFIGMNIAEHLTKQGIDVVLLDMAPLLKEAENTLKTNGGTYHHVQASILDSTQIKRIIKSYSITEIIHAAVITPDLTREKTASKQILDVNFSGTVEVLEAALSNKIEKLIYLSSASVYGDAAFAYTSVHEDTAHPRPKTLYAISKFAAEKTALRYKQLFDLDIRIVRVGTVFGPWERNTGVRDTLSAPLQATRLAYLHQKAFLPRKGPNDWVYSRDIAGAVATILQKTAISSDVLNISSGTSWTVYDWCRKLQTILPDFQYELVQSAEQANISFHGSQDRSPLSIQKLIDDAGYTPAYDLDSAFDDYISWIDRQSEFWQ